LKRLSFLFLFLCFIFAVTPMAAHAVMLDYPSVKLQALDKITARTITFEGKVGTTLKFASIFIKIQTCQKPPAYERSDAAAFLQIWEVTPQDESKWIFSGWMFASSPAVSAMDHPIYDVWVVDCVGTPIGGDASLPPPEAAEDINDEEAVMSEPEQPSSSPSLSEVVSPETIEAPPEQAPIEDEKPISKEAN
jgi:hypothetical protein